MNGVKILVPTVRETKKNYLKSFVLSFKTFCIRIYHHAFAYCFFFIKTTDITLDNLNMEYLNAGLMFPRNRDIDGKAILVLKSKLHIRGLRDSDQLLRGFIYWMERMNR